MEPRSELGLWPFNESFWGRSMPSRLLGIESSMPDIDLVDQGDSIKIRADMPGVKKGDIKINVDENFVTISAETKHEKEEEGKNYYFKERASSGYYRRLRLPTSVDPESSKAKFEDGTLEVTLKKTKNSGKSITID